MKPPLIAMSLLMFLVSAQGIKGEAKPYTGKVFLGVSGDTVELPEDPRYESTHGMLLTRIAAGSTGDAAGREARRRYQAVRASAARESHRYLPRHRELPAGSHNAHQRGGKSRAN